jgi:hypothetical protein
MSVSPGEVLKAVCDFVSASGLHFQNSWHFQHTGNVDMSDTEALNEIVDFVGDIYDQLADQVATTLDDPEVYVDKVAYVDDEWVTISSLGNDTANTTPANTSDVLPLQAAACLVGLTERPKSKGRKFLIPFGEDQQIGGSWVAGCQADLAGALLTYLSDRVVGSGKILTPGVASSVTGTFLPFLSGLVNFIVFTQRRRVAGYGI